MSLMRLLVLGIVGYILYKLISNEIRKRSTNSKQQEAEKGTFKEPTGNMVKDPVCGAYVDAASSISVRDGAQVYRFCSYECRDSFLAQLRAGGRNIPEKTNDDTQGKSDHSE